MNQVRPQRVALRPPQAHDQDAFLAAVARSGRLHRSWVKAPATPEQFAAYLARMAAPDHHAMLVTLAGDGDGELVGVINLSNVVMGSFRSGHLGYYAFAPHAGRGLMLAGLRAMVRHAFGRLGLHRLEANIQPGNAASLALARACGFQREGFSPRYLKIAGRWRDHERWALLADTPRPRQ